MAGREKGKRKGKRASTAPALPSFLPLCFRVCALTRLSRSLEQANTKRKRPYLFLDLLLSNHSCYKSSNRNLFTLKHTYFCPKIFFIKACNLHVYLDLLKTDFEISRTTSCLTSEAKFTTLLSFAVGAHCISSNNSLGDYYVFRTKRGRLLEEGGLF